MTDQGLAASDESAAARAPAMSVLEKGIDRLEAIARGEHIESVIRKKVFDEQPVLGKDLPEAPGLRDNVRPGDIAEIGEAVMAGGKAEARQEQVL